MCSTHPFLHHGSLKRNPEDVCMGSIGMRNLHNGVSTLGCLDRGEFVSIQAHRHQHHIRGEISHVDSERPLLKDGLCRRRRPYVNTI